MDARERERLAAAQAGDRGAFDALCQTHRDDLLALCRRFVDDRDAAQDLVQELFARAWVHLPGYRGDAALRTWLWEIGRNLCLNHLRARRSQLNQRTVPIETSLEVRDTEPTPEDRLVAHADRERLRAEIARCAALRRWDASDWALFALRIDECGSYAEFARSHGRDEAYWRNRWRDKIKPALELVRRSIGEAP